MTGMLTGGLWLAASVLAVAGTLKLARPASTAGALRDAGLPSHALLVRALGVLELAAAGAALLLGGVIPAAAVSALYLAFTVFAWRQRRASSTSSCGCLGDSSAPLTWTHVVLDGVFAVLAAGAALTAAPSLPGALAPGGPLDAAGAAAIGTAVALLALGTWLVRLVLTELADLRAVIPEPGGTP